ncbi:MAG TPA: zf-TFIIB domain-containing protein [Thermoanaerobaculia bacterium]|nr:zf-TFIIB domain-containing protein [Thermoanaerobaculia bacterium]
MFCPRCHPPPQELERLLGDAQAYTCNRCHGMFFKAGELDRLAEPHQGDLEYTTVDRDSLKHADRFGPASCPLDGTAMDKVDFNIYTDIILDYCPSCGGFWLDGGELERINSEVRELNRAGREIPDPPMLWFAKALWELVK